MANQVIKFHVDFAPEYDKKAVAKQLEANKEEIVKSFKNGKVPKINLEIGVDPNSGISKEEINKYQKTCEAQLKEIMSSMMKTFGDQFSEDLTSKIKSSVEDMFSDLGQSIIDSIGNMHQELLKAIADNTVTINPSQIVQVEDSKDNNSVVKQAKTTTKKVIDDILEAEAEADAAARALEKNKKKAIKLDGITYDEKYIKNLAKNQSKLRNEIQKIYNSYVSVTDELFDDRFDSDELSKELEKEQKELQQKQGKLATILNEFDKILRPKSNNSKSIFKNEDYGIFDEDYTSSIMQDAENYIEISQKAITIIKEQKEKVAKELREKPEAKAIGEKVISKERSNFKIDPYVNEEKFINKISKAIEAVQEAVKEKPIEVRFSPEPESVANFSETLVLETETSFNENPLKIGIDKDYLKAQIESINGINLKVNGSVNNLKVDGNSNVQYDNTSIENHNIDDDIDEEVLGKALGNNTDAVNEILSLLNGKLGENYISSQQDDFDNLSDEELAQIFNGATDEILQGIQSSTEQSLKSTDELANSIEKLTDEVGKDANQKKEIKIQSPQEVIKTLLGEIDYQKDIRDARTKEYQDAFSIYDNTELLIRQRDIQPSKKEKELSSYLSFLKNGKDVDSKIKEKYSGMTLEEVEITLSKLKEERKISNDIRNEWAKLKTILKSITDSQEFINQYDKKVAKINDLESRKNLSSTDKEKLSTLKQEVDSERSVYELNKKQLEVSLKELSVKKEEQQYFKGMKNETLINAYLGLKNSNNLTPKKLKSHLINSVNNQIIIDESTGDNQKYKDDYQKYISYATNSQNGILKKTLSILKNNASDWKELDNLIEDKIINSELNEEQAVESVINDLNKKLDDTINNINKIKRSSIYKNSLNKDNKKLSYDELELQNEVKRLQNEQNHLRDLLYKVTHTKYIKPNDSEDVAKQYEDNYKNISSQQKRRKIYDAIHVKDNNKKASDIHKQRIQSELDLAFIKDELENEEGRTRVLSVLRAKDLKNYADYINAKNVIMNQSSKIKSYENQMEQEKNNLIAQGKSEKEAEALAKKSVYNNEYYNSKKLVKDLRDQVQYYEEDLDEVVRLFDKLKELTDSLNNENITENQIKDINNQISIYIPRFIEMLNKTGVQSSDIIGYKSYKTLMSEREQKKSKDNIVLKSANIKDFKAETLTDTIKAIDDEIIKTEEESSTLEKVISKFESQVEQSRQIIQVRKDEELKNIEQDIQDLTQKKNKLIKELENPATQEDRKKELKIQIGKTNRRINYYEKMKNDSSRQAEVDRETDKRTKSLQEQITVLKSRKLVTDNYIESLKNLRNTQEELRKQEEPTSNELINKKKSKNKHYKEASKESEEKISNLTEKVKENENELKQISKLSNKNIKNLNNQLKEENKKLEEIKNRHANIDKSTSIKKEESQSKAEEIYNKYIKERNVLNVKDIEAAGDIDKIAKIQKEQESYQKSIDWLMSKNQKKYENKYNISSPEDLQAIIKEKEDIIKIKGLLEGTQGVSYKFAKKDNSDAKNDLKNAINQIKEMAPVVGLPIDKLFREEIDNNGKSFITTNYDKFQQMRDIIAIINSIQHDASNSKLTETQIKNLRYYIEQLNKLSEETGVYVGKFSVDKAKEDFLSLANKTGKGYSVDDFKKENLSKELVKLFNNYIANGGNPEELYSSISRKGIIDLLKANNAGKGVKLKSYQDFSTDTTEINNFLNKLIINSEDFAELKSNYEKIIELQDKIKENSKELSTLKQPTTSSVTKKDITDLRNKYTNELVTEIKNEYKDYNLEIEKSGELTDVAYEKLSNILQCIKTIEKINGKKITVEELSNMGFSLDEYNQLITAAKEEQEIISNINKSESKTEVNRVQEIADQNKIIEGIKNKIALEEQAVRDAENKLEKSKEELEIEKQKKQLLEETHNATISDIDEQRKIKDLTKDERELYNAIKETLEAKKVLSQLEVNDKDYYYNKAKSQYDSSLERAESLGISEETIDKAWKTYSKNNSISLKLIPTIDDKSSKVVSETLSDEIELTKEAKDLYIAIKEALDARKLASDVMQGKGINPNYDEDFKVAKNTYDSKIDITKALKISPDAMKQAWDIYVKNNGTFSTEDFAKLNIPIDINPDSLNNIQEELSETSENATEVKDKILSLADALSEMKNTKGSISNHSLLSQTSQDILKPFEQMPESDVLNSFWIEFNHGRMSAEDAAEGIYQFIDAKEQLQSNPDFQKTKLSLVEILNLLQQINYVGEKGVLFKGEKSVSAIGLGSYTSAFYNKESAKPDTKLHVHPDGTGTFSNSDIQNFVNQWKDGIHKIQLIIDGEFQELDFSGLGRSGKMAADMFNAAYQEEFNRLLADAKNKGLDPMSSAIASQIKEGALTKALQAAPNVKFTVRNVGDLLQGIEKDIRTQADYQNIKVPVEVKPVVKAQISNESDISHGDIAQQDAIKVENAEEKKQQAIKETIKYTQEQIKYAEELGLRITEKGTNIHKNDRDKFNEAWNNRINQNIDTVSSPIVQQQQIQSEIAKTNNALTEQNNIVHQQASSNVQSPISQIQQQAQEEIAETNAELTQQIQTALNAAQVMIAEGSSVSINGSVKIDSSQFSNLENALNGVTETSRNLYDIIEKIYSRLTLGANVAVDAVSSATAPINNINQELKETDNVIEETEIKLTGIGKKIKASFGGDINLDKAKGNYKDIKEAVIEMNKALDADKGFLRELGKSADIKATYFSQDDDGETNYYVKLQARFKDIKGEIIDVNYLYDTQTKKLEIIDKTSAKLSQGYTEQEKALKAVETQLNFCSNKLDDIKTKYKVFNIDDFGIDDEGKLFAKVGTEAEEVYQVINGNAKKAVVNVINGLSEVENKFNQMKTASESGTINQDQFEVMVTEFKEKVFELDSAMNAVNRKINTQIEHTSNNLLRTWQKEYNQAFSFLNDNDGNLRIDTSQLNSTGLGYIEQYKSALNDLYNYYKLLEEQGTNFTEDQILGYRQLIQTLSDLKSKINSKESMAYVEGKGYSIDSIKFNSSQIREMSVDAVKAKQVLLDLARQVSQTDVEFVGLSKDGLSLKYTFRDIEKNVHNATISIDRFGQVRNTINEVKNHTGLLSNIFGQLKDKVANLARYFSAYQIFYKFVNAIRSGVTIVRELDTAMVEMEKVTKASKQELNDFAKSSHKIAQEIGSTASIIQNSAADWMGKTLVPLYSNI